jgi:hypothetical protein
LRIFKTKALARFTPQQGIGDANLVAAVKRAVQGLIDADLGGRVIKQRVARPGEGKRGGFRMLIGFGADRAVFSTALPRTSARTSATVNSSLCETLPKCFSTPARIRLHRL